MAGLPNVNISLGNGNLGRVSSGNDGVAGLVLTGAAVAGKLELDKAYQLSSTKDLVSLGVTKENNALADKEVRAFYAAAGEGSELHLMVVAPTVTLTQMCDSADASPLNQLLNAAGGRIRLVGVNKIAAADYEADTAQGIDGDAITAAEKAQQTARNAAEAVRPFRLLMPAPAWTGSTESLFKPREGSSNAVAFVLASDDTANKTAAIGMVLGRAAAIELHQSIARVRNGAIASNGWFTNGKSYLELAGMAEALHDAGYIFFRKFPTRNGAYLNDDATAAPLTDDYSALRLGRVIDKARTIIYDTYIGEIQDNVAVDENGKIPAGICVSFESMIENAVLAGMDGQISGFSAYVDPDQNILSTSKMKVECKIVPQGILSAIEVNLEFANPALSE